MAWRKINTDDYLHESSGVRVRRCGDADTGVRWFVLAFGSGVDTETCRAVGTSEAFRRLKDAKAHVVHHFRREESLAAERREWF